MRNLYNTGSWGPAAKGYRIAGKFGESRAIHQTKTIQISTYNYNLLGESIHSPNFFSPNAQNE